MTFLGGGVQCLTDGQGSPWPQGGGRLQTDRSRVEWVSRPAPLHMAQLMGTLCLIASRLTLSTDTNTVYNLNLDGNMDVVLI